ncbi:MAG: hypothetical protein LAE24_09635 [Candidatus Contendobacter sp.]|nr:hypothetical protein [Candidatus Contendobacter sp.]
MNITHIIHLDKAPLPLTRRRTINDQTRGHTEAAGAHELLLQGLSP